MKVVVASDHGGMNIRKELVSLLEELNIEYIDLGCECEAGSVDYPDFAFPAAEMVANGRSRSWYFSLWDRHRYVNCCKQSKWYSLCVSS